MMIGRNIRLGLSKYLADGRKPLTDIDVRNIECLVAYQRKRQMGLTFPDLRKNDELIQWRDLEWRLSLQRAALELARQERDLRQIRAAVDQGKVSIFHRPQAG